MEEFDTGNPARDELLEFLAEMSEDINATSWCAGIEFETWRVAEGGTPKIGRHELFEWQLEQLPAFRERLGEWPRIAEHEQPERDGSNVEWIPLDDYRRHHRAETARLLREAEDAVETLRSQPLEEDDLEALEAVSVPWGEGRPAGLTTAWLNLPKLRAHGLVRDTGERVWEIELTEEGQELLAARSPRP